MLSTISTYVHWYFGAAGPWFEGGSAYATDVRIGGWSKRKKCNISVYVLMINNSILGGQ